MEQSFVQRGGDLVIESCASHAKGGCLHVSGHFHQRAMAVARFKSCTALHGGCVSVKESMKVFGFSYFDSCAASGDTQTGRIFEAELVTDMHVCHEQCLHET